MKTPQVCGVQIVEKPFFKETPSLSKLSEKKYVCFRVVPLLFTDTVCSESPAGAPRLQGVPSFKQPCELFEIHPLRSASKAGDSAVLRKTTQALSTAARALPPRPR